MWMYIVGGIVALLLLLLFSPIVIKISLQDTALDINYRYWFYYRSIDVFEKKEKPNLFIRLYVGEEKPKTKKKNKKKKTVEQEQPNGRFGTNNAMPVGIVEQAKLTVQALVVLLQGYLKLLENARVPKFNLTLGITGKDAADAAMNYGEVCSVVYPFLGLVDNHVKLVRPKVNIYCDYGEETVVNGYARIHVPAYHVVGTVVYMIKELVKKNLNG